MKQRFLVLFTVSLLALGCGPGFVLERHAADGGEVLSLALPAPEGEGGVLALLLESESPEAEFGFRLPPEFTSDFEDLQVDGDGRLVVLGDGLYVWQLERLSSAPGLAERSVAELREDADLLEDLRGGELPPVMPAPMLRLRSRSATGPARHWRPRLLEQAELPEPWDGPHFTIERTFGPPRTDEERGVLEELGFMGWMLKRRLAGPGPPPGAVIERLLPKADLDRQTWSGSLLALSAKLWRSGGPRSEFGLWVPQRELRRWEPGAPTWPDPTRSLPAPRAIELQADESGLLHEVPTADLQAEELITPRPEGERTLSVHFRGGVLNGRDLQSTEGGLAVPFGERIRGSLRVEILRPGGAGTSTAWLACISSWEQGRIDDLGPLDGVADHLRTWTLDRDPPPGLGVHYLACGCYTLLSAEEVWGWTNESGSRSGTLGGPIISGANAWSLPVSAFERAREEGAFRPFHGWPELEDYHVHPYAAVLRFEVLP